MSDERVTDRPWRQGASLAVLASLNIAIGFAMQWYTVAVLGAGAETDALFAGRAVPMAVLAVVASSFMSVIMPLISGEDEVSFRRTAWMFAALTFVIFAALAGVLAVTASLWVPIVTPGLRGSSGALAIELTQVQLAGMVGTAIAGVLAAVSRARNTLGWFVWTEGAPLVATLGSAVALVIYLPRHGVHAAAWIQVWRLTVFAALLMPALGRFPGWPRDMSPAVTAWRRLRPLLLGTSYLRLEIVLDRALSSLGVPGDLSLYYLCQQVCQSSLQLFYNAFIAPASPVLSKLAKAGNWVAFAEALRRLDRVVLTLAALSLTLVLAAVAGVVSTGWLAEPLRITLSRSTWLLAGFVGLYVAAPVADSLRTAFYATGDTRSPVRIDVWTFSAGLVLRVVAFASFGVVGMALAASAQSVANALLLRARLAGAIQR